MRELMLMLLVGLLNYFIVLTATALILSRRLKRRGLKGEEKAINKNLTSLLVLGPPWFIKEGVGATGRILGHAFNRMSAKLTRHGTIQEADSKHPPRFAEYLLWFLPKKTREPLLGDLEEEYRDVYDRFGKRRAQLWYYGQVLSSYWPLLCGGFRRLARWGIVAWLGDLVRRFIA